MKLCFNAGPQPVEEYFSFAKENSFPWIELSCNNPNNFLDKWTSGRIVSAHVSDNDMILDRHIPVGNGNAAVMRSFHVSVLTETKIL